MFTLQLKRTFRAGLRNIAHNKLLSASVIGVIAVTLFIINIQAANVVANNLLLQELQEKVNVSVYLKDDLSREEAEKIRAKINSFSGVEKVELVPKEETLQRFQEDHRQDKTMQEVIDILGENPFGDILKIKARNPDQYREIVNLINQADFKNKIKNISYEEHREVIDSLNREIKSSQKTALIIGITLSVIAVLVTFNTVAITIYTHRKEIEIMKLVGASNWFTVAPFVWEGMFYGILAAFLAIGASYLYLYYISNLGSGDSLLFLSNAKFIRKFLGEYFRQNIAMIIGGQLLLGILLGVLSSVIAVRKYLKV